MKTYLVTGAAGLIGSEICAALADRGHAVIGLVRKNRILKRGEGELVETIDWQGEPLFGGQIALVPGDVSEANLGIAPVNYAKLAAQIDCIIHCAAVVQFDASAEIYDAINVGGTANVLQLARAGAATSHVQVSTAYVCGEQDGAIPEDSTAPPDRFANPYEASKFAAEQLVREAMADGLTAAIARPSIVVGRESDGAIAAFDSIYMAFKLLAEGRIKTIPATASATLNFVALDHVFNGIIAIAERIEEVAGHAYHLVADEPMSVGTFFELIGSYPQFANPAFVTPDAFDPDALSPIERRFHNRVATLYASYFQRNPHFDQANAIALLGSPGPVADESLMRRQIDFAMTHGFLPAESVPA